MATQYEQGPEAKSVESGFELDNLLRKERGANRRTMMGITSQHNLADQRQGFDRENAATQQGYALDRMLKGEELKEQFAQKEADRSAPFIQAMIGGNPDTAKTLGFTSPGAPQIQRAGAMAEPEAAGITAPIAPGPSVGRTPTLQEAAGAHRAVPGMTQALLQQQLTDKASNKPVVVGKDASLVTQGGQELFKNAGPPKQSQEETNKLVAEIIAKDPAKRGRVWAEQRGPNDWIVKESASESLVENSAKWLADMTDSSKPFAERQLAAAKYEKDLQDKIKIYGLKNLEAARMTPMKGEALQRYEAANLALEAGFRLQTYTPEERKKFIGLGMVKQTLGRWTNSAGLPIFTSEEESKRFSEFQKDNGMIEQMKFAIGGKQLTTGEQAVVNAFIPHGRELTHYEYTAKLKSLTATMQAAQEIDFWISNNPRQDITPTETRVRYTEALRRQGIDVSKTAEENMKSKMTPGQQLREKYGKP